MNSALRRLRPLIVPCAWLLSLTCVAAIAATLIWRFSAPAAIDRPVSRDSDPRATVQRIVGQGAFAAQATARQQPAPVVANSNFSVVGLATGFAGGPGFALLKVGSEAPEAFVEGDEVSAGVRLERILPDGVEIDRNGRIERVLMPEQAIVGVESIDPPTIQATTLPGEPSTETAGDAPMTKDN